ncbi:MAG: 30S ribosomal protein S18 [Parcubacteria group bacterium CG1_02_41_12]|nr:MAG: 30S ribosomal protein S18 [Parcubacteria group bacterium CG1_02_41_12]PIP66839.1 MAG: 30S ribosomal protein S18 [Parcubacteria group bacterium CG22_combo_CG10-13_8_21_14_all_41_9]PIQ80454.1 MAG: 30S ribosomal protein S18 [Parcubacteria group bacterium CG11_big_fil_rev_8_21_14_0_20_41_14]PIR57591.1 MAG: 30S ribosomal protein S18 [Parcubacteria group bacterium CG10_big_fil_rev_8_21_14_0_10_41_35]
MPIPTTTKDKGCFICKNNIKDIDYKDPDILNRFTSAYGKIMPKKRSGACAKHQRAVSRAIKNSRIMGFMPFVVE